MGNNKRYVHTSQDKEKLDKRGYFLERTKGKKAIIYHECYEGSEKEVVAFVDDIDALIDNGSIKEV